VVIGSEPGSRGVLVVRAPNWVGDLVMATPVLEAACADPRFAGVHVAVREHLAPLLAGGPLEARVVPLARGTETARLRSLGAAAALLLSNSFGAAWRALRARIPVRAGAALGGRGPLLTHRVVPPSQDGRRVPIPTAHLQRDVAGLLGIAVPSPAPRLASTDAEQAAARAMLDRLGLDGAPYFLAAPGAAFGASKLWPPERFGAALDALFERTGLRAVVTGGPGEEAAMRAVAEAARHPALSLDGEPRDLVGLKALVAGSRLVLVGDSGPRWIAAAFGVPCVSVLGPNFPELTATSLERCAIVRRADLECAPCLERTCPLGHHRCLADLAVEPVVDAALDLLRRFPAA